MSWFALALIAPLIWACVNLIDDHLLKNVYQSAAFGAVISGAAGLLPALYILLFSHPQALPLKIVASAVAAGVLTVVFYYFYFRTLDNDDPSVAIALNNISPALVLVMAFFILGERLHGTQYLGIGIIITGSLLLAALDVRKLKLAKSAWFALYGALAYSTVSILAKYAYGGGSFSSVYLWISAGFGVGGLTAYIFFKDKRQIAKVFKKNKKPVLILLLAVEVFNTLGEVVQGAAINGGPVTIVRALEGIQPLYVLAIGIILSQFFPKYFRERKDKRFNKKIACMVFMVIGLFML